jgi:hypothetical protein
VRSGLAGRLRTCRGNVWLAYRPVFGEPPGARKVAEAEPGMLLLPALGKISSSASSDIDEISGESIRPPLEPMPPIPACNISSPEMECLNGLRTRFGELRRGLLERAKLGMGERVGDE